MRRSRLSVLLLLALLALSAGADCNGTWTGLIPLAELGAGLYKGMPGGLYPGGSNARPAAHDAAGLRLAAQVVPRDSLGLPDPQNGKIVLLSIGMSNTTQEFSTFIAKANADPQKNPQLVLVDGAVGGQTAAIISSTTTAPGQTYWTTVDQRIAAAKVTATQVQAVWLKEADAGPNNGFPGYAKQLQTEMASVVQILRARFPNLKLVYLSGRTYGGYATSTLNPEPYAYETSFAVKWLIEQQINGDAALSYDAGKAPWLAWGPQLWADGLRLSGSGLSYACDDFVTTDRTHPSAGSSGGQAKVAGLLLDFFKSDATARPWFVKAPATAPPTPKPAALVNAASYGPTLAVRTIVSLFGTELAASVPPPSALPQPSALPLPSVLNDVSVEINGIPCPLLYVSPTQINLILPPGAGTGSLRVRRSGVLSDPLPVALLAQAPGIFANAGVAAAVHLDGRVVSDTDGTTRVKAGETIELFVTGLGAVDYAKWQAATAPVVRIGGRNATVTWAGPSPQYPGLDQINLTVPSDTPAGKQTLDITSGALVSAPVTLPIS